MQLGVGTKSWVNLSASRFLSAPCSTEKVNLRWLKFDDLACIEAFENAVKSAVIPKYKVDKLNKVEFFNGNWADRSHSWRHQGNHRVTVAKVYDEPTAVHYKLHAANQFPFHGYRFEHQYTVTEKFPKYNLSYETAESRLRPRKK